MSLIQNTVDELRKFSEGFDETDIYYLKMFEKRSRQFSEIFGVYGPNYNIQEKELQIHWDSLTFEQKRKYYETTFPNQSSPAKRQRAREMLNHLANNPKLFMQTNTSSTSKTPQLNVISSRSWNSTSSVTGSPKSTSCLKTKDIFSGMTYDAAYSNSTQSQCTIFDETSTPVRFNMELATPLHTCVE